MGAFAAKPLDGAAWVTGASDGIGRAVVLLLAEQGFTVYASARSKDKLEDMASGFAGQGKIIPVPLNVSNKKACIACVKKIVRESGNLAMCILNAGIFIPMHARTMTFDDFEKTIDVNLVGTINGLLPAVQAMQKSGKGQIAIVSSTAGYGGLPKSAAYGATKAALINLAESLKFDLDQMNIKIQLVNPGFVKTPATDKNDFPMPFLMPVDKAAERTVEGLKTSSFEVTFPRRFTWMMKFVNLLPYSAYFAIVRKITGKKPS